MAAKRVVGSRIRERGEAIVTFDDGSSMQFASREDIREWAKAKSVLPDSYEVAQAILQYLDG